MNGTLSKDRTTLTGDIRLHPLFHSRFLKRDRDVLVYLPPAYEEAEKRRFPVLYLHDGQNIFDGETSFVRGQEWEVDETAERLIRDRSIKPVIIVGIHNAGEDRIDEYTPTYDDRHKHGGSADQYGRFIVEELKPFIDRTYRTWRAARSTGLGGSSLGGLVSLYLWHRYPHVFGRLAVMSPSIWWDHRGILRMLQEADQPQKPKLWLDIGTQEGQHHTHDTRLLRDLLLSKGWREGRDLKYVEARGHGHNEWSWARRVPQMLRFLFPK